jgi:hypothetical protein
MKIVNREVESSECNNGKVLRRDRFSLENCHIDLQNAISDMTDGEEGMQYVMTNSVTERTLHGSIEHLQGHSQLSATRPDILIDDQRRLHHDDSIVWSDQYNPSPAINQIDIHPQFSGQDMVEMTFIPICTERIAVPVLIESREKPEQIALSTKESQIRCIWTDGSRDDLGNVGAAIAWTAGTRWAGLKYRLGRNKEVFDAELFALLQATIYWIYV